MRKYILLYLSIVFFASCSRSGYYYTNTSGDGEEDVPINKADGIKQFRLGAYVADTSLDVIVFFKLADTSNYRNYSIKRISFTMNNLSSDVADKAILFIDRPLKIKYTELSDVVDLSERIHSGLPLEFVFRFRDDDLINGNRVSIQANIDVVENGREVHISKDIKMDRKSRYRFWLATK